MSKSEDLQRAIEGRLTMWAEAYLAKNAAIQAEKEASALSVIASINEYEADLSVQAAKKALLDYKISDEGLDEFFWDNPEAIPDSVGG
jgi:3-oxoacyl-[acyl-carrier-protein] synthase III